MRKRYCAKILRLSLCFLSRCVINIPLQDASLQFFPYFIPLNDSLLLAKALYQDLAWRQDQIQMYGKMLNIPRLQAWYGDPGTEYSYSNLAMSPLPWTEQLQKLRIQVEAKAQHHFNSVLANCYRDNQDSVSWHSDDEPELGQAPVIASLSLGAERFFHMKHKQTGELFKLKLPSGSLLIMKEYTQNYWLHAVPKTRQVCGRRINLTFRKIVK